MPIERPEGGRDGLSARTIRSSWLACSPGARDRMAKSGQLSASTSSPSPLNACFAGRRFSTLRPRLRFLTRWAGHRLPRRIDATAAPSGAATVQGLTLSTEWNLRVRLRRSTDVRWARPCVGSAAGPSEFEVQSARSADAGQLFLNPLRCADTEGGRCRGAPLPAPCCAN